MSNENLEPSKLRRGHPANTPSGDGYGAIWLRPKHNREGWKNRDRYDCRADEGVRILRQHVTRSHAQIGHRNDKRQRRGREECKRQQIAFREFRFIQAKWNDADDEKANAKEN